jgi:hypothetical protein
VLTAGTLVLFSSNLTSNTGVNGGAVYTDYGAAAALGNCILTHNTAQQSGEATISYDSVSIC